MNDNQISSEVSTNNSSLSIKNKKKQEMNQKLRPLWYVIAILSGIGLVVDIVVPTPEDIIPVIGWLDEGMLGAVFLFALDRLGIRIPFLSRFFGSKKGTNKAK